MTINQEIPIEDLVKLNYKIALMLDEYNIDYCSEGGMILNEACSKASIGPDQIISRSESILNQCHFSSDAYLEYLSMKQLCDYIVTRHHEYIRRQIPLIRKSFEKIDKCCKPDLTEMEKTNKLFDRAGNHLIKHINNEEEILFPYVVGLSGQDLARQDSDSTPDVPGLVQTASYLQEHVLEEERIDKVVEIARSSHKKLGDCCTLFVALGQLEDFKDDLDRHLWIENTYLYPKAIALENGTSTYKN